MRGALYRKKKLGIGYGWLGITVVVIYLDGSSKMKDCLEMIFEEGSIYYTRSSMGGLNTVINQVAGKLSGGEGLGAKVPTKFHRLLSVQRIISNRSLYMDFGITRSEGPQGGGSPRGVLEIGASGHQLLRALLQFQMGVQLGSRVMASYGTE